MDARTFLKQKKKQIIILFTLITVIIALIIYYQPIHTEFTVSMSKASNIDDDTVYYQFDKEATVRVSLSVQRRICKDRDYVTGTVDIDGEVYTVEQGAHHFMFYEVIKNLNYFFRTGEMREFRCCNYDNHQYTVHCIRDGKKCDLYIFTDIGYLYIIDYITKDLNANVKDFYTEKVAFYEVKLSDSQ
ncbi:MAG: hypothetical protein J6I50_01020 [Clostridia bacterium]|nr:hypothetical protein [Clostridia bacterium]